MFAFIHIFSKTKTDSVRDALRSYIPDAVNVRLFQILRACIYSYVKITTKSTISARFL